jgi:hypothetical protein
MTRPVFRPWQFFVLTPLALMPLVGMTLRAERNGFDAVEMAQLWLTWGVVVAIISSGIVWMVLRGSANRRIVRFARRDAGFIGPAHAARIVGPAGSTAGRFVVGIDTERRQLVALARAGKGFTRQPIDDARISAIALDDSSLVPNAIQVIDVRFESGESTLIELLGPFDGLFPLPFDRAQVFVESAEAALGPSDT